MQRVLGVVAARVEVRAGVEEGVDRIGVAAEGGEVEGGAAEGVGLVDLGAELGREKGFVEVEVDWGEGAVWLLVFVEVSR